MAIGNDGQNYQPTLSEHFKDTANSDTPGALQKFQDEFHSAAKDHDPREWNGLRKLDDQNETARLNKLSDDVAAQKPGAVENMRDELLHANEQYKDSKLQQTWLLSLQRKNEGKPEVLQYDKNTGSIELKNPVAPAQPGSDLFASKNDTLQSILPEAAIQYEDQGAFSELVVSMAAIDPRDLHKMLKDNGNGTCTVTFPGAPEKPITVPIPHTDQARNKVVDGGTWPKVLADAYKVYVKQNVPGFAEMSPGQIEQSDTEIDAANRAMKALTGQVAPDDHTSVGRYDDDQQAGLYGVIGLDGQDALGARLQQAVDHGRPGLAYDRTNKKYYGVLDYYPASKEMLDTDGILANQVHAQSLEKISPHTVNFEYGQTTNDLFLKPDK